MYQTNHQKTILEYFQTHQNEPVTAQTLVQHFQTQINKATIYRKLSVLENQKTIRKSFNSNKNCYEYHYSIDCEHHLHLVCTACGKITHLTCQEANQFVAHLLKNHNFSMDQGSTMLFGICKECSAI